MAIVRREGHDLLLSVNVGREVQSAPLTVHDQRRLEL
jgi:hypothetical protein